MLVPHYSYRVILSLRVSYFTVNEAVTKGGYYSKLKNYITMILLNSGQCKMRAT